MRTKESYMNEPNKDTTIQNLWKVIHKLSELVPDCFWHEEFDGAVPTEGEFVLVRAKELGNDNETIFFDKWVDGHWCYHPTLEHYLWMELDEKPTIKENIKKVEELSKDARHVTVEYAPGGNYVGYCDLTASEFKKEGIPDDTSGQWSVHYEGYLVVCEGEGELKKTISGRKFFNTEQEAMEEFDRLYDNSQIDVITVYNENNNTVKQFTRGYE